MDTSIVSNRWIHPPICSSRIDVTAPPMDQCFRVITYRGPSVVPQLDHHSHGIQYTTCHNKEHVTFTTTCHFHVHMSFSRLHARDPWTSSCAQAGFVESVQKCDTKTPHGNANQFPRHCGVQRDPWARSRDQVGFVVEVARSGGAITPCMVAQTNFLCTPKSQRHPWAAPRDQAGFVKNDSTKC